MSVCLCVYVYLRVCVRVYVYLRVYVCIYVHVCLYVCARACLCVFVRERERGGGETDEAHKSAGVKQIMYFGQMLVSSVSCFMHADSITQVFTYQSLRLDITSVIRMYKR